MRNRTTALALVAALLAARDGFAADSFKATDRRMAHFYLAPTREEFDAIQEGIKSNLKKFKKGEEEGGSATLAAVFLARVSEKYHYPLMDMGDLGDMARSVAAKDASKFASYVNDDSLVDPGKLDIWWISYFATGETRYLDNILAQVADVKSQSGTARILVAGAADWSVASNCEQHPAVLDYVRSVLARTPPPGNADALREVLTHVGKHGQPERSAPAGWTEDGKPVPDNDWRKSSGDFGALLDFTRKPDEVFEAWNKPGEYATIPPAEDTAHRNETVVGLIFFTGCKPDAAGNCNATVDYLILRPDGTVYGDLKGGELWKGKPAPRGASVQLAVEPLGIRVEPTDPFGEYTVRATVRDLNAGISLQLERKFHVANDAK